MAQGLWAPDGLERPPAPPPRSAPTAPASRERPASTARHPLKFICLHSPASLS